MTQAAYNYGRVLYELEVPKEAIDTTAAALEEVPDLVRILKSPVITGEQKHRIIDRVFPQEMRNFFKVLLRHQDVACLPEIFKAYHEVACEMEDILIASLFYVTEPDAKQLEDIKQMLRIKYQKKDVELCLVKDPKLIGGFILRVGDLETDWSMKGRLRQLEQKLLRR